MPKSWLTLISIVAAVVLFAGANIVASTLLRPARLDLTEGRLFTLSDGAKRIAHAVPETIALTLYFSERSSSGMPDLKTYARRVQELLEELARSSKGKITLQVVDPPAFSIEEDKAVEAGILSLPLQGGDERLYFGLVGVNSVDKRQVIPFFDPGKEEFLEYDLTRMIYLLSDAPKREVGLMSWLPLEGAPGNPMMRQGGTKPQQIYTQLSELFELRPIATTATDIPSDIGVLLVVHPKNIPDATQYAIDQFALRGGRVIAFIDPLCEADVPPGMNMMQALSLPKSSSMPALLAAWGLEMDSTRIAADKSNALRVTVGSQQRPEAIDYVAWMALSADRLNRSDPVTGVQQTITLFTPGILKFREGSGAQVTPLITTSASGSSIAADSVAAFPDPKKLLADYSPEQSSLMLAARVSGMVNSAFPDGPPKPAAGTPDAPPAAPPTLPHIAQSTQPVNILVFADCDMLTDRAWVNEQRVGGVVLAARKMADNGDLLIAAIDNMTGSSDLIALRARGKFSRPFSRTAELRTAAEQRFLTKEQELRTRLQTTMTRINELQQQRSDTASPPSTSGLVLSPEQRTELDKLQLEMVATRTQLRDVKFQLSRDIDSLGSTIKAVNIVGVPLLVGAAALLVGFMRSAKRRRGVTPT